MTGAGLRTTNGRRHTYASRHNNETPISNLPAIPQFQIPNPLASAPVESLVPSVAENLGLELPEVSPTFNLPAISELDTLQTTSNIPDMSALNIPTIAPTLNMPTVPALDVLDPL